MLLSHEKEPANVWKNTYICNRLTKLHAMKKILTTLVFLCASVFALRSQDLNASADNILGEYSVLHDGQESRVLVYMEQGRTYGARVVWLKNSTDKDGNKRLDRKNPDKSLKSVPLDQVVILTGMKYDAAAKKWSGGKVYDPARGIRANAACLFGSDGKLHLTGSLFGISETVVWEKLK